jgi:hypothetical protein
MLKGADLPEDFLVKYSRRNDAKQVLSEIRSIEERKQELERNRGQNTKPPAKEQAPPRLVKIGNRRYKFELQPMGKQGYECILDASKSTFYVNIEHPQYLLSRSEGSLPNHFRKVIVFEIARAISGNSLSEFINQYSGMMLQEIIVTK